MNFPLDLLAVLVRSVVSSEVRFVRPLRQGTTRQVRVFALGGILSPGHEGQATHCRSPRAQGPPGSSSRHLGAPPAELFLLLALGSYRGGGIALQEAHQGVEMRSQEVLAPEVNDNALLDLRALAIGFHQAQILVVAAWCLDGADEQIAPPKTLRISRGQPISQGENSLSTKMLALHILS